MSWLNGLSADEIREILMDGRQAYYTKVISIKEFEQILIKLGYNATDIEEELETYKPEE